LPSRQGTRGLGRRAAFIRNAKGKEEKVARGPLFVARLFASSFLGGNDDVHPLFFPEKFNILAIEFPAGREKHGISLSFFLVLSSSLCSRQNKANNFRIIQLSENKKVTCDLYSL